MNVVAADVAHAGAERGKVDGVGIGRRHRIHVSAEGDHWTGSSAPQQSHHAVPADDARLLDALGRMCLQQRLWGKAQSYLEASLAVEPTQQTHLELARLADQLERPEEANKHYRASALLDSR